MSKPIALFLKFEKLFLIKNSIKKKSFDEKDFLVKQAQVQ